jgi:nucleoside-diphosphate-sugar epimerase
MESLQNKMRVLILGGTNFVGRTAAIEAVRRGHDVTTFNRGTKPTPEGAKAIIGDRLSPDGYKSLDGLTFDTVLDTWSLDPVAVRTAVDALRGRICHYIYISSISVYDESRALPPLSEESPVINPEKSDSGYAADKRGGELAAESAGVPLLIARPGLILGPYEGIDGRLPWWLGRLGRGSADSRSWP